MVRTILYFIPIVSTPLTYQPQKKPPDSPNQLPWNPAKFELLHKKQRYAQPIKKKKQKT